MNKIIPKLSFHYIKDTELDDYAKDKVTRINTVPAFAAVNPSAAQVENKTIDYVKAVVKSDDGNKADTALKKQRRMELETLLALQAQDCARIASGDLALYLKSGYDAKNTKGSPTGELPQVTQVALAFGNNIGELKISWDAMADARNFTVQVFTNINNPDGSVIKECIKPKIGRSKTILSDLPSGKDVFVRVRANGGSRDFGPWSDVTEKRVP